MSKVISLVNQKGGVGKTTTSINLSAALGECNKSVLLIDLDPQGNATTGLGYSGSDYEYDVHDVLTNNCTMKDAIIKTKFKNLSLIPSSLNLAGLDIEFGKLEEKISYSVNYELKRHLNDIRENYDYIIIDCQPSIGYGTMNALHGSDSVIIPVQCEFYALDGITQILNSIIQVQKNSNSNLKICGVLLTMFDRRTNIAMEVVEEIRRYFKEKAFDTIIPRLVRLVEAPSHGVPINIYDPTSRACEAYANLAKEVIDRNGE